MLSYTHTTILIDMQSVFLTQFLMFGYYVFLGSTDLYFCYTNKRYYY